MSNAKTKTKAKAVVKTAKAGAEKEAREKAQTPPKPKVQTVKIESLNEDGSIVKMTVDDDIDKKAWAALQEAFNKLLGAGVKECQEGLRFVVEREDGTSGYAYLKLKEKNGVYVVETFTNEETKKETETETESKVNGEGAEG